MDSRRKYRIGRIWSRAGPFRFASGRAGSEMSGCRAFEHRLRSPACVARWKEPDTDSAWNETARSDRRNFRSRRAPQARYLNRRERRRAPRRACNTAPFQRNQWATPGRSRPGVERRQNLRPACGTAQRRKPWSVLRRSRSAADADFSSLVLPGLFRMVSVVEKNGGRVPVQLFLWKKRSSFQD